jgi:hypothetical protein
MSRCAQICQRSDRDERIAGIELTNARAERFDGGAQRRGQPMTTNSRRFCDVSGLDKRPQRNTLLVPNSCQV